MAEAAVEQRPEQGAGRVPTPEKRIEIFRLMSRIRHFDQRWHRLFQQGMTGPGHASIGMEAIAAAFGVALREDDYTFATYRGHGHILARDVPMRPIMAELLGKATGLAGGKGGSMHLTSVEHGMMGSYAVIGAHLPVAAGAALSAQYRGSGQVAVCFFGDGTTNIGAFHEALNLAAVWKLPVVFVCENNQYMEYTPIRDVTAVPNPAADRAAAYGLQRILIDGNDPDEVHAHAGRAIDLARSGGGPSLIEAVTYRHLGHASADPGTYRPEEEIAEWLKRDPIPLHRGRLVADGVPEAVLDEIEAESERDAEDAAQFAVSSPDPDPAELMTAVWADGGASWRN
ncbi:thiamine pyrophosphate-dependent dehydrogenase E1 component subunit alpha [Actinomadura sp. KC345]|uniref:thiamine pyrophosphate-dependent dehydrogenase E1 component subunit alpha n=1 Tax=Actinomadura sp. KC345 TaxID=2530371 RepID=UPI00104F722E|nr:thiamine pyrophosphate-dependent dehydrogenase E1 component subunit alpha [Actinomadura sp. KC345]TDC55492.1 thiamine pyrophosphate-dependent dehydrogenase E1 component subunit alpha [Actinomadura sp. KC345]